MPQPYTRIEIKIPDELMSQINQSRLETPVATWIKEAIKQRLEMETEDETQSRSTASD